MDDSNNVSDEEVVIKMKDTTEKEKGEHRIIICTGQLEGSDDQCSDTMYYRTLPRRCLSVTANCSRVSVNKITGTAITGSSECRSTIEYRVASILRSLC